jgi:hypothetical protein
MVLPSLNNHPDLSYAPILLPGTIVNSTVVPNSTFTVLNSINFKDITPNLLYRRQYRLL